VFSAAVFRGMLFQSMIITDFIAQHARWYPDKTAIVFEDRRLTWKELNDRANRIANNLRKTGVSKGDRVAIVSPNCLEYPEIMFGALKAGTVIVPVSTMLRQETVCGELRDAEVKAVFAAHPFLSLCSKHGRPFLQIVLAGRADQWIPYEEFLQGGSAEEPECSSSADDPYNIVYSSGTTGNPKGIVHTHQARVLFSLTCGIEFRLHNESVSLISTPIYTNGTQLIYLPTILVGGTLVLMRSFDPLAFLELIGREKCTHAFLVPTQFIRIMEHPGFHEHDMSSIEVLLSAAAPLSKDTKKEILKKFPNSLLAELYGLTEGISTVLRPNEQFSKPGSVGKPRLGGDIKIIDDNGNELPRGETGEIVGFNASMMTGYYRDPERTSEAQWRDRRGRIYLRTGDVGRLDEDGYLYIIDRKKDLIISGGINIFPSDIEHTLMAHPEVAEAAVIGVPHREWGETPVAFIVKKDLKSRLSENKLKEWANDRLAGYQKLSAVVFRDSLPRNDLGKILKTKLRENPGCPGFS
jgi:acyl-CoA synthetase (AMP-forming)/AMP-acid ligase II